MNIEKLTDEIIALSVVLGGVIFAGYITYINGAIPDMFIMAFAMIVAFYFKSK